MKKRNNNRSKFILPFKISLLIVAIVFSFTDSHAQSKFKIGKYSKLHDSNEFTFFEDSTFSYNYYGITRKYSEGKWSVKNNKILILNSTIQNNIIPLEIKEIKNTDATKKIQIKIAIPEQDPKDYKCIPFINGSKNPYFEADMGSYSLDINDSIKTIRFEVWRIPQKIGRKFSYSVYSLNTEELKILTDTAYDITINISDALFPYKIFNNTELNIKNNKLIFKDTEERKTSKLELEK